MRISDWSSDVRSSDLLDGQQGGGQRRIEDGGHARGRAGHEKCLALRCTEVEPLGEKRYDGAARHDDRPFGAKRRSEEHTYELQSLMSISYAVCCLKKKDTLNTDNTRAD